jgi:hypothetical protein
MMFFLVVLLGDCSDEISRKIDNFWKFISENEGEIFALTNSDDPLYDKIFEQIQLIDKNIYIMLGNEIENNKKNIVISSGGKSEYFSLCDEIVNFAPNFIYLNPISLFPPLNNIEPFIYDDIVITIDDFRVAYENSNGKLNFNPNGKHFQIIKEYDDAGDGGFEFIMSLYKTMLSIMTQQLLGERTFGEKIKMIVICFPEPYGFPDADENTISLIELKNSIK